MEASGDAVNYDMNDTLVAVRTHVWVQMHGRIMCIVGSEREASPDNPGFPPAPQHMIYAEHDRDFRLSDYAQ